MGLQEAVALRDICYKGEKKASSGMVIRAAQRFPVSLYEILVNQTHFLPLFSEEHLHTGTSPLCGGNLELDRWFGMAVSRALLLLGECSHRASRSPRKPH